MTTNKTRLKMMDTIICRTPAFSINDDQKYRWTDLKELIKESSPEFYRVIAECNGEHWNSLNEKEAFSTWKYFNRARFRSTPFGNFAAISFVAVETRNIHPEPLKIKRQMISHRYTDWSAKDSHLQKAKKIVRASEWFQSNLTCYVVGDQLRYIRYINGQFELATIIVFDELDKLLTRCRSKQNKQTIYELMNLAFGMETREIDSFLCQLIECQLLITEQMPNIIGEDYFERLQLPKATNPLQYIIAEREIGGGQPALQPLNNDIPEYLDFIKDFMPVSKNTDLDMFRKEFTKKFDLKAVPLSIALDPETGIGYGNMAQDPQETVLITVFARIQKAETSSHSFTYTTQHRFLLNALMKGGDIHLEEFKNEGDIDPAILPNTLSVIFQYWKGMPILQNAGGCTANSLLGRFTLGCERAEALARQIVDIEEKANPDVLFFDIAYQAEKRVDNVNRRKQIYNYELPILTWPSDGTALSMDDILVMTRDKEVILWSKQYNKRLMPRVATAYNYNRSDLAVYRFLCDLQHQRIQSDLTFNFRQLFPGLDHYPRVSYKNIIVSPAMWRLNQGSFSSGDKKKDLMLLQDWFKANNIREHFKCGNSDQTLCFDAQNMEDLQVFLTYCRQNNEKEIYIQEALIDETSTIADENGKQYLPQYIANYFHEQPVYRPLKSYAYVPDGQSAIECFIPGSEWLYFEIYCHPQRSNDILEQHISKIVYNHKKYLHKWFFIRYSDPKPHIRLRLQVKDVAILGLLIDEVKNTMEPLRTDGLVPDIQIRAYARETERYGRQRMDKVEEFFYQDSKYALRVISVGLTINQLYLSTLKMMDRLFALSFENIEERIALIKAISDSFSNEFSLNNEDYKNINKSFESLRADGSNYHASINETLLKQHESAFCSVVNACEKNEKASLAADLVHMHVNRVFYADQRMHEAILYQYLLKQAKARKHLAVSAPVLL